MNTTAKDALFRSMAAQCELDYRHRDHALIGRDEEFWEDGITTGARRHQMHLSQADQALHTVPSWSLLELLEAYPEDLGHCGRALSWQGVRLAVGLVLSPNYVPGVRRYQLPEYWWQSYFSEGCNGPSQLQASGEDLIAELFHDGVLSRELYDHSYSVTVGTPVIGRSAIFVQTHQRPR